MSSVYRVMLGRGSSFARECLEGGYIGVDFLPSIDLTGRLTEHFKSFNHDFIPLYLHENPAKSKIAAGLACGNLWTATKGMLPGDLVLSPSGQGFYHVGDVLGDYEYHHGENLPHRRRVRWREQVIERNHMSDALQGATRSAIAVVQLDDYRAEINALLQGGIQQKGIVNDPGIENVGAFHLEKHLQKYLVDFWDQTELGKSFDIFQDEDGRQGVEFQTDDGRIDLLCISKDQKTLLVVELKKGMTNDRVIGQVLRYMGYIKDQVAESTQRVKGAVIALDDEASNILRALDFVPDIWFFKYKIHLTLSRVSSPPR